MGLVWQQVKMTYFVEILSRLKSSEFLLLSPSRYILRVTCLRMSRYRCHLVDTALARLIHSLSFVVATTTGSVPPCPYAGEDHMETPEPVETLRDSIESKVLLPLLHIAYVQFPLLEMT